MSAAGRSRGRTMATSAALLGAGRMVGRQAEQWWWRAGIVCGFEESRVGCVVKSCHIYLVDSHCPYLLSSKPTGMSGPAHKSGRLYLPAVERALCQDKH